MWNAIVKLWKEDLSLIEFIKEIHKNLGTVKMVILYFAIVLAVIIGLII